MRIYVFVHIYLCVSIKGINLLGQARGHLLADVKMSLYLFAVSMGLEHISMEMSFLLFRFAGSQMIH